ncbi:MAG: hypothetical protein ACQESE_00455 [Nanobdellota archaeon]
MSFLDKLQFWKHSEKDDMFSDSGSDMDFDTSFTGANEQSGFSQGMDSQGVTGQSGDLPPLDMSSNDPQQQAGQNYDPMQQNMNSDSFVNPNAHLNQPQAQDQNQQQFPQQQTGSEQVTMATDDGERKIGKQLAEEYMNHQSRYEQGASGQQNISGPDSVQQGNQGMASQQGYGGKPTLEHSLELINVKLDSLKNATDAIAQRLLKIENEIEKERKRTW